jgi:hypothetical protein
MPRAPEEVKMVKDMSWIIPTTVTGVIIDNTIRGIEFVARMSKPANHDNRYSNGPSQPR